MLSEGLQKAQAAISSNLLEAGQPVQAGKLLDDIRAKQEIRDIDLREALWFLIGQGKISLAWDWKLSLIKDTDTQPR